jgi:hypothetical protein
MRSATDDAITQGVLNLRSTGRPRQRQVALGREVPRVHCEIGGLLHTVKVVATVLCPDSERNASRTP